MPFLEDGAEYDRTKHRFANWNRKCCGCCQRHKAVFPVNYL